MKQRAFTLMELMIVIVIIGILSAVGMVMFGGQAEKAKIAIIKNNHTSIVTEITLLIVECSVKGYVGLMSRSGNKNISERDCYGSSSNLGNYYWFFGQWMVNHLQNTDRYKNPFAGPADFDQAPRNTRCGASSGDSWLARTNINASNSWDHVTVCTCFKKPCKDSSNRLENKIYLF